MLFVFQGRLLNLGRWRGLFIKTKANYWYQSMLQLHFATPLGVIGLVILIVGFFL